MLSISLSRNEVARLLFATGVFAQSFKKVTKDDDPNLVTHYEVDNDVVKGRNESNEEIMELLENEAVPVCSVKGKNENNIRDEDVALFTKEVPEIVENITRLEIFKKSKTIVVITEGENFHEKAPYTLVIKKLLSAANWSDKKVYLLMCKDETSKVSVNFYNSWVDRLAIKAKEAGVGESRFWFGLVKPKPDPDAAEKKFAGKATYTYGMSDVVANLGSARYQFKPDGETQTQGYLELDMLRKASDVWSATPPEDGTYTIFEKKKGHADKKRKSPEPEPEPAADKKDD